MELLVSKDVLVEVRDVLRHPSIRRANPQVTPERIVVFLELLTKRATFVEDVPAVIPFPRDPKDAPYLNLAVEGGARFLVTRDAHRLLQFAEEQSPEANKFRNRWPGLEIIEPVAFLRNIHSRHEGQ